MKRIIFFTVIAALAFGSGWYLRPLEDCVVAGVTLNQTLDITTKTNCSIRNVTFKNIDGDALLLGIGERI